MKWSSSVGHSEASVSPPLSSSEATVRSIEERGERLRRAEASAGDSDGFSQLSFWFSSVRKHR